MSSKEPTDKCYTPRAIAIRFKEPWFRDILRCLLETLFFIKSSENIMIEEKSFQNSFTYPKIKNDPDLERAIEGYLDGVLRFDNDFIGQKKDMFSFTVRFSNGSNYEAWECIFKVKKDLSEDDVKDSLKGVLADISEIVLGNDYIHLDEHAGMEGRSVKYEIGIEQKGFPVKKRFVIF